MEEISLVRANVADGARLYRRMCESFPEEELREYEEFQRVLSECERYAAYFLKADGQERGFITVWELSDFVFVEHFAVYPLYRGQNVGGRVLAAIQARYPRLVLEIEPPVRENQVRRLQFYRRAGFVVNDLAYRQPPYRAGGAFLPMRLLSWPASLRNSAAAAAEIYRIVYARTSE